MRRIRKFAGVALVALAVVALFAPARLHAIVFGWADTTNSFPNTGAFIVKSPTSGRIFPICSGMLISPTVFLTAAYCTDYYLNDLGPRGYTAYVSFDNPIPFGELTTKQTNLIPVEQAIGDPQYNQVQSDPHDIAVLIVSDKYTRGITPASLPTAGLFDELSAQNGLKTAVIQLDQRRVAASFAEQRDRQRRDLLRGFGRAEFLQSERHDDHRRDHHHR